ncbi:hypothetical protein E4U39_000608 [Claviceps sp. Clav50 group G5]|nr:hypothetical protein E4U39_000608 [Claviceps sp. Clav50 group G5]
MNIPLAESKHKLRGHAYVTLANSTAAKAVVRILNRKLFQGRVIVAKLLIARTKDVGVGSHDPAIKDTELESDEAAIWHKVKTFNPLRYRARDPTEYSSEKSYLPRLTVSRDEQSVIAMDHHLARRTTPLHTWAEKEKRK